MIIFCALFACLFIIMIVLRTIWKIIIKKKTFCFLSIDFFPAIIILFRFELFVRQIWIDISVNDHFIIKYSIYWRRMAMPFLLFDSSQHCSAKVEKISDQWTSGFIIRIWSWIIIEKRKFFLFFFDLFSQRFLLSGG